MLRFTTLLLACALAIGPSLASAQTVSPSPAAAPVAAPAAVAKPDPDKMQQLAQDVLLQLQNRSIDRSLFNDKMNAFLTDDTVRQLGGQLSGIGTASYSFLSDKVMDNGDALYVFLLRTTGGGNLDEYLGVDAAGKIVFLRFVPDHTH